MAEIRITENYWRPTSHHDLGGEMKPQCQKPEEEAVEDGLAAPATQKAAEPVQCRLNHRPIAFRRLAAAKPLNLPTVVRALPLGYLGRGDHKALHRGRYRFVKPMLAHYPMTRIIGETGEEIEAKQHQRAVSPGFEHRSLDNFASIMRWARHRT